MQPLLCPARPVQQFDETGCRTIPNLSETFVVGRRMGWSQTAQKPGTTGRHCSCAGWTRYTSRKSLIRKRTRTGGGGDDKGCHATALLKASWCRPCWRPRQRGCSGRLLPRCLGPSTWTWSGCNLLQSYAAMGPDLSALNKGYSAASHQCLHGCSLTWRRGIVLSDPRKIAWLFEYTIPNFDTFPFIVLWCLPRIVNTLIMKRITPN